MKDLKDRLIKLGKVRKDLRPHLRPVLAELKKQAASVRVPVTMSQTFRQMEWEYMHELGQVIMAEFNKQVSRESQLHNIEPAMDSRFGNGFEITYTTPSGGKHSTKVKYGSKDTLKDFVGYLVDEFGD